MALYFFDVRDQDGFRRDEIGTDLGGFEEISRQVQMLLPDLARERMPSAEVYEISCEVRDETGRRIYRGALTYRGTDCRA